MKLGDIYYWNTEKVAGRDSRFKYHLFICEPVWPLDHAFLFINSTNYGGDYAIQKADYPFFTNDTSYVDVGGAICYSDQELKDASPDRKGQMSNTHLQNLFHWILESGKMPGREEKIVCNALRSAF